MSKLFFEKNSDPLTQKWLFFKNSKIHYHLFGKGPRKAICFHGYGEDGQSFAFLEKHAGRDFTFIAPDLPFHGKTEWNDGLDFTSEDLSAIITQMIVESPDNTQSESSKYTLIGFSLGGRMALKYYQAHASDVEKLVLMAPDGLKVNFWYWLSTQTAIGNNLFSFTMKYPRWFFAFLKLLNKMKLVNSSIFKFVNYYIGDPRARQLLFDRWTSLRKITPDLRSIKSLIRKHQTQTTLIYGRHDRIILTSVGKQFCNGIEPYCEIAVIQSGHQLLHEKHVSELLPVLMR